MRCRHIGLVLALTALLTTTVLTTGCAKAPPNLSTAGLAAFQGTRVVKALDVLRDAAVSANMQIQPNGVPLLSTVTTRQVVTYHQSAVKTIQAVPSGWRPTVQAGLDELVAHLPASEKPQLAPYVALVATLIMELQ